MGTLKSLVWEGEAVTERMRAAQAAGIAEIMGQAVTHARLNHTWNNRTAILEGSITIVQYPVRTADGARGVWGVFENKYALIHELGGTIVPRKGKALHFKLPNGEFRTVAKVTIPARPYLRPAGDVVYPNLAAEIRKAYARSAPAAGGGDA